MMDFFVRELRAVVDGPLAILRFGTCGGLSVDAPPGSVVCASHGAAFVTRNYDFFSDPRGAGEPYQIHRISPADSTLSELYATKLRELIGAESVVEGVNVTADSFYSSQGRVDPKFDDHNEVLVRLIVDSVPNAKSMEMETYLLYHLANACKEKTFVSAAAIVLSNRHSGAVVDGTRVHFLEESGGKAALEALVAMPL